MLVFIVIMFKVLFSGNLIFFIKFTGFFFEVVVVYLLVLLIRIRSWIKMMMVFINDIIIEFIGLKVFSKGVYRN